MRNVALLVFVLMGSGCHQFSVFDRPGQGPRRFELLDLRIREHYVGLTKAERSRLDDLAAQPGVAGKPDDALQQYWNPKDGADAAEQRRAKRNEIISALIEIDDHDFITYLSKAGLAQRTAAFTGDFTVLTLTTAASVSGGLQAKSVLSGLAALVTGTRIAFDQEVFYQNTLPLLLHRMQQMRNEKRAEIVAKFGLSDADYPLTLAMSDVYDYFEKGSLTAAIQNIAQDTPGGTAAAATVDEQLASLAAAVAGAKELPVGTDTLKVQSATYDAATSTLTVHVDAEPDAATATKYKTDKFLKDLKNSVILRFAQQNLRPNGRSEFQSKTKVQVLGPG